MFNITTENQSQDKCWKVPEKKIHYLQRNNNKTDWN